MAIITLSKRAFNGAGEFAQRVSELLDYKLVSRYDVIEKTSQYGISEIRQARVRSRNLGMWHRMDSGWRRYLIYSRAVLTKEIRQGCLVYLGANGRALVSDFPNVLNVQVRSDIEHRIDNLMKRTEYVLNRKRAKSLIQKIDEAEDKWRDTFHKDGQTDHSEYDLIIDPVQIGIRDACELIRSTLEEPKYQTTYKSMEAIDLLTVAAEFRARIAMKNDVKDDDIEVAVQDGVIVVKGSVASIEDLNGIRDLID